eukprot:CAMPEP_0178444776 /NCGR_PEP_ID=MMETSP0689_2-20121128/39737_1 /TAXON_ID=160604 /ORGANISM="Amphidinium massartii, Strain CS-259" /LENGTH=76 /DNA_ID=CAMNT_0020069129 /DNA_START=408 /DNA_END=638 /DNA_ORIENTATION=-
MLSTAKPSPGSSALCVLSFAVFSRRAAASSGLAWIRFFSISRAFKASQAFCTVRKRSMASAPPRFLSGWSSLAKRK